MAKKVIKHQKYFSHDFPGSSWKNIFELKENIEEITKNWDIPLEKITISCETYWEYGSEYAQLNIRSSRDETNEEAKQREEKDREISDSYRERELKELERLKAKYNK